MKIIIPVAFYRKGIIYKNIVEAEIIEEDDKIILQYIIDVSLKDALIKGSEEIHTYTTPVFINDTLAMIQLKNKVILLKDKNTEHIVTADRIMFAIADRSYSLVHIFGMKPFLISKNLAELEKYFDCILFYRVNKKVLMNNLFLKKNIKCDCKCFFMPDDSEELIGRKKLEGFEKWVINLNSVVYKQ